MGRKRGKSGFPSLAHPGKLVSRKDPKTEEVATDMVFLPHMGKVEVADMIPLVKADK